MSFNYNDKKPAVWTEQDQFAVSEKGIIKPSGAGYDGRLSFVNLQTAEHILNNLDSFKRAVEQSRARSMTSMIDKELTRMRVNFIKQGLTPEQAEQAVQAILANKSKQQPA